MSPKTREELRRFEQRMHDKGSDGFADGPRPWEHWDESGNQASSRVWEGSARRVYRSRSHHSLGYRLLSFLAFLALATLLVGIGGVYYSHTHTQQLAHEGIQPLPEIDRTVADSPAPEPLARAETTPAVEKLNVLKAPAAGSAPAGTMTPAVRDETVTADSTVETAPPAAETSVPAVASVKTPSEESVTEGQPSLPPADNNIDSVAIETVVTEKSVTTTVYTRHPQQGEPEVVAAIETTPPPFVHEITPAAVMTTATADTATIDMPGSSGDELSEEGSTEDAASVDTDSTVAPGTMDSPDQLTLTSPATDTQLEESAATATTLDEDTTSTAPAEKQADAGEAAAGTPAAASQDTAALVAPNADSDRDASAVAAAIDADQDASSSMTSVEQEAKASAAPPEPVVAESATETSEQLAEATRIALVEPPSPVEDTTPVQPAPASTSVKEPIMPVAGQGGWVINLASYTWKSTANRKLALFRDKGVDAEVFEVMIKDKPMYRVRVTGFESSRAAKAEAPSIEQTLGLEGAWVSRR